MENATKEFIIKVSIFGQYDTTLIMRGSTGNYALAAIPNKIITDSKDIVKFPSYDEAENFMNHHFSEFPEKYIIVPVFE